MTNETAKILNVLDLYGFEEKEECCYDKHLKNGFILICYMGTSFRDITMESKSWELTYGTFNGKASFGYYITKDEKMSLNDIINKLQDIMNDINEKYELREKIYAHLEKCGFEANDYIYSKKVGDEYILVDLWCDMSYCVTATSDQLIQNLFKIINLSKINNRREIPIKEFLNTNI